MNTQHNPARDALIAVLEGGNIEYADATADAIMDGFVVIPRTALPPIEGHHEEHVIACHHNTFYVPPGGDSKPRWDEAYMHIAVAEYTEQQESDLASASAKLNARRDELAKTFWPLVEGYASTGRGAQQAVDRIIEMEEAAK